MSQNDSSLAQAAYTRAIKDVQREIKESSRWWLGNKHKDRIIVLKELEKRFRKHRDCLGTGARKGK